MKTLLILNSWHEILMSSVKSFAEAFMSALPSVVGALVLLLVGWLVAKSLGLIIQKLLKNIHLDTLANKPPFVEYLTQANIKTTPSKMIGKLVYWLVYLLFLVTAAETLGLTVVSTEISKLISYLPQLFAALVIFLIGVYIITFVRDFIKAATASLGMSAGKFISSGVFYLLLIILSLTTLKQAGIDTDIITANLNIIIAAILLSFSISYGFASRDILSNILATFFSNKIYQPGQTIEVEGVKGKIIEINSISLRLETDDGEIVIPTQILIKNKVKIIK